MGKYFECNLPKKAPYWLHSSVRAEFERLVKKVHQRMDTLEEALALSGMDGATFAKYAKVLFDEKKENDGFDRFTADAIASFAKLMDDGTKAEPRWEWPNAMVMVDSAFVTTKEWEAIRHFGVGGSDAAVVLGISPYQTATELYHTKVGSPELHKNERASQSVFDRGHIMEDRVIEAFTSLTGARVIPETRMFISKKYPYCTANIDAIITFDGVHAYVFEAKSTIKENWQAWARDRVPGHYIPQTHQYPAVLDDDRVLGTYIGCLFTEDSVVNGHYITSKYKVDNFVCRFVDRDKDIEDEQLATEQDWFETYVENNNPPPMTGDPTAENAAIHRFISQPAKPGVKPTQWDLKDVQEMVEQWLEYGDQKSMLKKKMDGLDDAQKEIAKELITQLGEHTEADADIDDESYYEIKNDPRTKNSVDIENLNILIDAAVPHLPASMVDSMRACIKTTPDSFRVFSIRRKFKKKPK